MIQIKTMDICFARLVLEARVGVRPNRLFLQFLTGKGKLDYNGCFVGKQPKIKGMVFFAEL